MHVQLFDFKDRNTYYTPVVGDKYIIPESRCYETLADRWGSSTDPVTNVYTPYDWQLGHFDWWDNSIGGVNSLYTRYDEAEMIQIGAVYPEDYSDPLYRGTVKIYRHMGLVTNEDTNYNYHSWYNDYLGDYYGTTPLYAEPITDYIAGGHLAGHPMALKVLIKVLD